jgi:hypothetical protein
MRRREFITLLGGAARGGRGLGSVSRRSEVLPYSGKQIGGGDRCKCDKERRNQIIDHNTNDNTAWQLTKYFAVVPGAAFHAKLDRDTHA